jgi:aminoglycoside phosphotransferase (APT) family kinase protein
VDAIVEFERLSGVVAASLGADLAAVQHVPGSVANQDYEVDLADGRHVFVKVGPRSELAAEVWALGRAAAAGVPVPLVLAYEDAADVTPTPFVILELLPTDEKLTPRVMQAVGQAMAYTHTIGVVGYGPIRVLGSPMNPESVAGRYESWRDFVASILWDVDELTRVRLLTADIRTQIHRAAEAARPSPLVGDSGVLLHADVKRQHIMAVDGELTGVIDWGDACAGDPAWDLARASMLDSAEFRWLADAYPGAHHDDVTRLLPVYRLLWNTQALAYEYRASGDWFAEFQRRIAADLTLISESD